MLISPETAVLPLGWEERLIKVHNENTRGITGWCLEVHDLALSKHAAGREKDLFFTQELARNQMVDKDTLLQRLSSFPVEEEIKKLIKVRIEKDFLDSQI